MMAVKLRDDTEASVAGVCRLSSILESRRTLLTAVVLTTKECTVRNVVEDPRVITDEQFSPH